MCLTAQKAKCTLAVPREASWWSAGQGGDSPLSSALETPSGVLQPAVGSAV